MLAAVRTKVAPSRINMLQPAALPPIGFPGISITSGPWSRAFFAVIKLPHMGSSTRETRVEMGMRALRNIQQYFDGKEPPDRVN